eukprot:GHVT01067615.1.p1 GENE.GHVT01067615.1~~GHVT01067615.1.p1  ORF type:complete len:281 (+),score=48.69 GHVT01067615.1:237-1079(+)
MMTSCRAELLGEPAVAAPVPIPRRPSAAAAPVDATAPGAANVAVSSPTFRLPGSGEGRMPPIFLEDSFGYEPWRFVIPGHYRESLDRILIPHGLILDRIEKLAFDIRQAFGDEELHLLCILKGSRGFFNHLLSFLNRIHIYARPSSCTPPYMEHYVRLVSYTGTESTGKLQVISEDLSCLKDKNILIVEDIIDTGHTLTKFCKWLEALKPRKVGVASLLEKRTPHSNGFRGDLVGFSVPDAFVVGFSLDYNEMFRDLEHISVLNQPGIDKYRVPPPPLTS